MSDPHDWNSWDNYQAIHEKCVEEHPFILDHLLEWTYYEGSELLVLDGQLICAQNVVVDVYKVLRTRLGPRGRAEVRGWKYTYNASFTGKFNVLRYDNLHADDLPSEHEFHRHTFDIDTGRELAVTRVSREQMPVLSAFLDEVAARVGFEDA